MMYVDADSKIKQPDFEPLYDKGFEWDINKASYGSYVSSQETFAETVKRYPILEKAVIYAETYGEFKNIKPNEIVGFHSHILNELAGKEMIGYQSPITAENMNKVLAEIDKKGLL